MSVVRLGDQFYPGGSPPWLNQEAVCSLCFSPVADDSEPVVLWHGGNGDLWLHGRCAGSFVLRLARDAWEIERDTGNRFHHKSRELHLPDRRWRVYVCQGCHPDYGDEYELPYVAVAEEASDKRLLLCPRCDGLDRMEEDVRVELVPVEGARR
jgi:hypothetical protein